MAPVSRRQLLGTLLAAPARLHPAAGEWAPLFDGRSLEGWKASENAATFKVEDGAIVAEGPRSHLFYTARTGFTNFELRAEVRARSGANSGIYFHTEYQEKGWPVKGFEVQINNTHRGEGAYRERKKTGSLYAARNVYKALARDDEWFTLHIAVRGKRVQIRVNDALVVDFVEPEPALGAGQPGERVLGRGTFALQGHDPHSRVCFRNIAVKALPDSLSTEGERPVVDDLYRQIWRMSAENYPVVDYHAHLRPGMALEDVLRESRRTGIFYGLAVNVGLKFPVSSDAGARQFLDRLKGAPVFTAVQGEGREWVTLVSAETLKLFDYVFTDAMTFTDDGGRRMRLWLKEEVGPIDDRQKFMDTLVDRTAGILRDEPIDIWASPTFLPDAISEAYDELWTARRMSRVIEAAVKHNRAIEINNRYRLPKPAFLKLARQAGAKFSFGTNNSGPELGRLEYPLEMVREIGLRWQDIFVPRNELG